MNIYLASKSPRRKELLAMMGVDFEVLVVDIPELIAPNESPEHYSMRVTQEKCEAAWDKVIQDAMPPMPVLCADTEVVLDGKVLGKPANYQEAFQMLKGYSGREHHVITSVGVKYFDYQKIRMDITKVVFATLSDEVIHHYLKQGDYQDKAGSYGIQSYIGQFISRIEGCFYSVMGLPLHTLRELLDDVTIDNTIINR